MKKSNLWGILLMLICIIACCFTGFCQEGARPVHIYLIGGATMADRPKQLHPETGWGTRMKDFFDSTVVVVNKATMLESKINPNNDLSNLIADSVHKGDYVLIDPSAQLKSSLKNDDVLDKQSQKSLQQLLSRIKEKQAIPVLITPATNRKFDDKANVIPQFVLLSSSLKKNALKDNIFFIDLQKQTTLLVQQFGLEDSKRLYNYLQEDQNPNYPQGKKDDVQLNEFGARKVAQIVLKDLRDAFPDLNSRVVKSNWSK